MIRPMGGAAGGAGRALILVSAPRSAHGPARALEARWAWNWNPLLNGNQALILGGDGPRCGEKQIPTIPVLSAGGCKSDPLKRRHRSGAGRLTAGRPNAPFWGGPSCFRDVGRPPSPFLVVKNGSFSFFLSTLCWLIGTAVTGGGTGGGATTTMGLKRSMPTAGLGAGEIGGSGRRNSVVLG